MAKKKKATPGRAADHRLVGTGVEALRASTADRVARYDPKATPGYTGNKASAAGGADQSWPAPRGFAGDAVRQRTVTTIAASCW